MIKDMSIPEVVDIFIGDCLLPSLKHKMRVKDIFPVFEQFCNQVGIAAPCSKYYFGRRMSQRFQKANINGYPNYFCEFKPGLIVEEEGDE